MNMRVSETLAALLSTMPVPTGVVDESSPPVIFWMMPPLQPDVFPDVHVPLLPVTVKLPVVLLSTIPFEPPLAEMDVKLRVPPELERFTAAAFVVATLTSPTVNPVAPLPDK